MAVHRVRLCHSVAGADDYHSWLDQWLTNVDAALHDEIDNEPPSVNAPKVWFLPIRGGRSMSKVGSVRSSKSSTVRACLVVPLHGENVTKRPFRALCVTHRHHAQRRARCVLVDSKPTHPSRGYRQSHPL